MPDTPYYGFTTPALTDPPDGPGQMATLAADIEALLQGGFRIPNGNLIVGDTTVDSSQRNVASEMKIGANTINVAMGPTNTDRAGLLLAANGVGISRLMMLTDGSVQIYFGSVYRPLPFAMHTARVSITTASAENGFVQVVYRTNLFTQTPVGFIVGSSSAQFYGILGSPFVAASGYYGLNHVERVAGSATLSACTMAVQMLPTSGTGPTVAAENGAAEDGARPVRFICHTAGCANEDVPIETLRREDDEVPAVCGPCEQPLPDMVLL